MESQEEELEYDKKEDEAEWQQVCENEGIQLDDEPEQKPETRAEPEPKPQPEQSQNPSIEGIRCQMKQLHTMLKCRDRSCLNMKNPAMLKESILQTNKAFMETVYVLKDSMVDVFGDKTKSSQEKKLKDCFTPVYLCDKGQTIYLCPQCNYKRLSKGAIYTHLGNVHDMPLVECPDCDFKSANKTSMSNHELHHKKKGKSKK